MTRRRRPQSAAPWQACSDVEADFVRFCRLLLCRSAPPVPCHRRNGPPISLEEWRLSISKIRGPSFFGPRARREATFFLAFFLDAHFRPLFRLFLRSGLILETSASQKPMFSLGKTMIYTFAPFPLPARFFHRKCPKRCKKEPKNRVISISIFRVPLFFGPEAVGKRHRSLPGALSEDLGPPGRPLGLLSEASGPHLGASEAYFP